MHYPKTCPDPVTRRFFSYQFATRASAWLSGCVLACFVSTPYAQISADEIVVPQIALQKVSRLILGRHWKGASEAQRERFTRSFKDLLIRSYAITMFEYTGKEELRYSPVELKNDGRIAVVPTQFVMPGQTPVPVAYYCLRGKAGIWKIYDIQIDGISLIISYRNQYDQYIDTHGLDALIESLQSKIAEIN